MTDTNRSTPDAIAIAAASFLSQAIDLDDAPEALAQELSALKRDANASIYTIQLDSSVGPAAFLVYAYVLSETGGDGRTGQELFDAGIETLKQAAQRNTPGPRVVAHGTTDDYGFILATTPGTYRALSGAARPLDLEADPADLPSTEDTDRVRAESAGELLTVLRQANDLATSWLNAIQSATANADGDEAHAMITFSEEETELALFLLDEDSIGNLLRSMNILVATAQEQTAHAMADLDVPANDDASDPSPTTWPTQR